ncbi:nucleotidyltransferase domain-containing protein [Acinetobacter sp. AOR15_HL]|uniref:nucleotidyltransferase domain-containing protein n=1 Tax=unclassified Acinetobacter TaxID=196816 RepID=UPI0022EB60F8|nr:MULTISPECIES: nucleotidyltransferase domain-containing protein [unclassified Acinetobacter]MDA3556157.1 nucleotidyltransferase domain-containing protein [Acinetobacter sp. AOR15_HL]MDA3571614.1 nucleotidyltransferase domain-containing protein [Acinetobacter sp. AOR14_HL]
MRKDIIDLVLEYVSKRKYNDIISLAVSGSQSIGVANNYSDIDIIAITQSEKNDVAIGEFSVVQYKNKRIEILWHTKESALNFIRTYEKIKYVGLNDGMKRDVERFVCAKPILGESIWDEILLNIQHDIYRNQLALDYRRVAAANFEDLIGVLSAGEYVISVDFVRFLLQTELEALSAITGDTYGRRKWLLKRLNKNKIISRSIVEGFKRYYYGICVDEVKIINWLAEAIRFWQNIQFEVNSKIFNLKPLNKRLITLIRQEYGDFCVTVPDLLVFKLGTIWGARTSEKTITITTEMASILSCLIDLRPIIKFDEEQEQEQEQEQILELVQKLIDLELLVVYEDINSFNQCIKKRFGNNIE